MSCTSPYSNWSDEAAVPSCSRRAEALGKRRHRDRLRSVRNRLVTLESRAGPTPFRYRYELQPNGQGTHLTLEGRISSAGLPGPLARVDSLATQLFKRGMKQNLSELKRIIEAAERPTDRSEHG